MIPRVISLIAVQPLLVLQLVAFQTDPRRMGPTKVWRGNCRLSARWLASKEEAIRSGWWIAALAERVPVVGVPVLPGLAHVGPRAAEEEKRWFWQAFETEQPSRGFRLMFLECYKSIIAGAYREAYLGSPEV